MKNRLLAVKTGMVKMVASADAKVFVDTNILLRAHHSTFAEYKHARAAFDRQLAEGTELWISRQVIREYLVQATHPRTFTVALPIATVINQLGSITQVCRVADDTDKVTTQLLGLLKNYPTGGKQIHDANIVATMLAYDIDTLLTLNIADFKRFDDKITLITL